ncbi:tyrosine-type recombinase/integrase [Cohnella silvisoli]|uniref:Tyrosine-type recombinase/integrase n=1 Tax=Cohnella silvisoli TaxID=2873699 RepID=A0ABV1L3V0_9BACL|nr:site-specific integrase [Cohnella silvisoli]MCD9026011.1 site-specific integrase [Cohnella silvisoli]
MAKKVKNIRERDGKFYFRYSIPAEVNGKLRRKQKETIGYDTLKEAEDEGIRIKAKLLLGTYIEEKENLLSEWADIWIESYAATGIVKDSTVKVRRDNLKPAKRYFTGMKLKDITNLQYQTFLYDLKTMKQVKNSNRKKPGYTQKTIRMIHEAMSMMFREAVQMKIISEDITFGAKMPGFQQTVEELENEEELPEFMEKGQLAHFLRTAKAFEDPQIYHALTVLAYTGLRIGELCALKTSDIDEVNKKVSITKTLHLRGAVENFKLGTPKTKSSRRKVDIGKIALKAFSSQAAWRKEYKFSELQNYYKKAEFVFINHKQFPGTPLSPRELNRDMKIILERAGLSPVLSPHSLRHTYTSLMAEAGVELPAIQRLLGHQNDAVTRRVYLHITEPKKREAVDRLDELMEDLI